uniref:Uncharacterized protein n=1 Tax=Arundo donax TaxID=35708 RepID=A0A0A9E0D8_ARUDO
MSDGKCPNGGRVAKPLQFIRCKDCSCFNDRDCSQLGALVPQYLLIRSSLKCWCGTRPSSTSASAGGWTFL